MKALLSDSTSITNRITFLQTSFEASLCHQSGRNDSSFWTNSCDLFSAIPFQRINQRSWSSHIFKFIKSINVSLLQKIISFDEILQL